MCVGYMQILHREHPWSLVSMEGPGTHPPTKIERQLCVCVRVCVFQASSHEERILDTSLLVGN